MKEPPFYGKRSAKWMLSVVVGCLLSVCGALAVAQGQAAGVKLPSRQDVIGVEQRCAAGHTGVAVDKVDTVISAWIGQGAASAPQAKGLLSDALQRLKDESSLPPLKAAYVTCVENGMLQFVDQHKAEPAATGALIDGSLLPTRSEAQALPKDCAGVDSVPGAFRAKVDSAVDDWLTQASTGTLEQAERSIDAALDALASGGAISPRTSLYLTCVKGKLHKFLAQAQERPKQVEASAASAVLARAAFASDQAMWQAGCKQAESVAVESLRATCGGRVFLLQSSECAQVEGESRTYTAQVFGECRVK